MTTAKLFLALLIGAAIVSALGFSRRPKRPTPNIQQIIEDGKRRFDAERKLVRPQQVPTPGGRTRTR